MSKTLYQINQDILDALDRAIDYETGEISDTAELDQLQIERADKLEAYALMVKNLEAETKAIRDEELSLAARRKQKEKTIESLKETLTDQLGYQKLETPRVKISWRKSETVAIEDWQTLDAAYLRHSDPKPDLMSIKQALKAGHLIYGAELVEKQNIQIK